MAKAKEVSIQIEPIQMSRLTCHIVGTTPMIMHRFSAKSQRQLLFPKGRANAAEKATNLKHDPLTEYRETMYRNRDPKEPAAFHVPAEMFSKALASAALDIPGASKSQILRLVSVRSTQINLFGTPRMFMSMVRMSDAAKTPDVSTRSIFPRWACQLEIEYVSTLLQQNQIANLLSAAGMIVGIGDWRPQKGGQYGKFRIAEADDAEYRDIVKTEGKAVQLAAFDNPTAFNADTEELYAWFLNEAEKRERVVPSSATVSPAVVAKEKQKNRKAVERKAANGANAH